MSDYEALRGRHTAQFEAMLPEHIARLDWSADALQAERQRALRALLTAAKARSSWHGKRLAHVDLERITAEDLSSIPPMNKHDLMSNFDGILTDSRLSRAVVEAHLEQLDGDSYLLDEYHAVASGGSSGTRGVFVYDWNGWLGVLLTFSRWRTRMQLTDPQVGLRPVRAVIAGGKASHISNAIAQTLGRSSGATSVPAALPLRDIVATLNELRPVMLLGYPSMIALLAHEGDRGELRIAPRLIATIAEPLLPEMRTAIGTAWSCPVINCFGASEGVSAGSCGIGRGMHLNEDLCIFELVNNDGRAVSPGERAAKLYITPLFNYAQPLIRYELTDEVTLIDEPCPCGSAMRRVEDIEGRSDDVFTYAGGLAVHPLVFRSCLGHERNIVEYQVRQTQQGATIFVRTQADVDTASLATALERELGRVGLTAAQVTIEVVDAFDRQQTGKLKRFFPMS